MRHCDQVSTNYADRGSSLRFSPRIKLVTKASIPELTGPTRRGFLQGGAAGIVCAAAITTACERSPEPPNPPERHSPPWSPLLSENINDLEPATLTWMAQMGLEHVVLQGTDWVDTTHKGYWTNDDIADLVARCDRHGLKLHSLMLPIAWLMNAMLGHPERDADIERIARSIQAAGAAGVKVIEWRWSPDFKWGDDVGYYSVDGRGGAGYKAFDYARVAEREPFPDLGPISRETLWERLLYFASPVMKAAEQAGVLLSLHPKDPPVKSMRGIDRILTNTDDIEAFLDAVPSPANGFTFCQGTVTEMGVDVIDAIRRIGGRGKIHHVHFRAVRGSVPRYTETFIDEGDVDMLAAMSAYREVNYRGSLVSDHTPRIPNDPGGRIGRTFSHGYIRGLVQAANAEST